MHPLLEIFDDAARGRFFASDGGVTFLPPLEDGREAVVAFTGHSVIASRLGRAELRDLSPDGFGSALAPAVLLRLAAGGTVGVGDVTLVARGTGEGTALSRTRELDEHPRVGHARLLRREVAVYGDSSGFFTMAHGLAGRREVSVECTSTSPPGTGRRLIGEARRAAQADTWLFAAVSPGNARSLRAFLSAGFVPIASEVLITPFVANAHR